MRLKTLLMSLGLGAGLMYFGDPKQGNRRRGLLRDRLNSWVNSMDRFLEKATRDARNRTRGTLAEMSARLSDEKTADWILEERVRSKLGRQSGQTDALQVRAENGMVYVTGPALHSDVDSILKTATRTRGVHAVDDQIQRVDDSTDFPALQEAAIADAALPEWKQENWTPALRLLSGVGGSLMTLYGLKSRGF